MLKYAAFSTLQISISIQENILEITLAFEDNVKSLSQRDTFTNQVQLSDKKLAHKRPGVEIDVENGIVLSDLDRRSKNPDQEYLGYLTLNSTSAWIAYVP